MLMDLFLSTSLKLFTPISVFHIKQIGDSQIVRLISSPFISTIILFLPWKCACFLSFRKLPSSSFFGLTLVLYHQTMVILVEFRLMGDLSFELGDPRLEFYTLFNILDFSHRFIFVFFFSLRGYKA